MSYPKQMFAILEGDQPKLVSLDEWAIWMGTHRNERLLARDEIDGYRVSTIFIGLDLNQQFYPIGRPLYWETMIFEPDGRLGLDGKRRSRQDVYQMRYATAEEARAGHAEAVTWLKARLTEPDSE